MLPLREVLTALLCCFLCPLPGAWAGAVPPQTINAGAGPVPSSGNPWAQSQPQLPRAPNVALILLDDVGFGAASSFGGPARTDAMDRLAAEGLRYNQFHTTGICSPTRAALLTGRNHHRVGFGTVSGFERPAPGYHGLWNPATATVARVLHKAGYATAAFGKWHNTPNWELGPAGPFDRWPTGLGFDYFYGFQGGQASQFETPLYRNTTPIEAPRTAQAGYHFTTDIVDDAIGWIHTQQAYAPDRPYFLYMAPGATHAPLQVPKEWVDKYRGRFDQGWDRLREETFARQKKLGIIPANARLTPRPEGLPAWDSLSPEARRLHAREAEVYAAFLAHTDYEMGRLIQQVRAAPGGENTLVMYIVGDNGASAEGGLTGSDNDMAEFFLMAPPAALETRLARMDDLGSVARDNHVPVAWAWAFNTPFQWTKQVASHLGGTRNPIVISWPARIKDRGGLRSQFVHVNDVVPTLYELLGLAAPAQVDGVAQEPMDGVSFAYSFVDPKAKSAPRRQYFETLGNRAIYADGWMASARHGLPWALFSRKEDFDRDAWELYNLNQDFSQSHDLAAQYPEKLQQMKALFEQEAAANQVLPLGLGTGQSNQAPYWFRNSKHFSFHPDLPRMPSLAAPSLLRSHRISAAVDMPVQGGDGVLLANGGRFGGYVLYVQDRHLVYENNFMGTRSERLVSATAIPAGPVRLDYRYQRSNPGLWGGGQGQLSINGEVVAELPLPRVGPPAMDGSFDIGQDRGSTVSAAYPGSFPFGGRLLEVNIDLE